jgi:predicted RNA-binding protein with PUA-like domain
MPMERAFLVKSEPSTFSFDDLLAAPNATTPWDGVRNHQARHMIRDEMRPGDAVLFYHSSTTPPGVVGLAEVASEPRPDPTQFDPHHTGYDEGSPRDEPRWYLMDVRAVRALPRIVTLDEIKRHERLKDMEVARRFNRLSVMRVDPAHLTLLLDLSERQPAV